MYIILMRHGNAEPEAPGVPNRSRALTEKGIRNVERTAGMLRHFLKENELAIFTSPYKRTRQTAEIVSEICGGSVQAADELVQNSWQLAAAHCLPGEGPILFVSHHPFLQNYLMTVCGAAIQFEPAAAAVIDYDPRWRQGELTGYFTPALKKLRKK